MSATGGWFVGFTVKNGEAMTDHWEPIPDEKTAAARFAEVTAREDVCCACAGQITKATEPHWIKGNF